MINITGVSRKRLRFYHYSLAGVHDRGRGPKVTPQIERFDTPLARDIVSAIYNEPDYVKASNYWRWLKRKFKQEGIQLVSTTHEFKFQAPDGKMRKADVLTADEVNILAKYYPNNIHKIKS